MTRRADNRRAGRPTPYPDQHRAAAPAASVWVEASAGSGKTKVLADRVIRLMLDGTPPDRILCLTFTRAAAAEMSIRINAILGGWAAADDPSLAESLEDLTGAAPDPAIFAAARRLFAEALDVPGGMKIQTIHAFCESLLGRFPLEAGLAPHFEVMDERTAAEMMHGARDEILEQAARAPDGPLARALAEITRRVSEQGFTALMADVARERGRILELLRHHAGTEGYQRETCHLLGVEVGETEADIVRAACDDGAFDADGLRRAAAALAGGSKTDQTRAAAITSWLADAAERAGAFDRYRRAFLTAEDRPLARLITKDAAARAPDALDILTDEANRLAAVQERRNAVVVATASAALFEIAAAILGTYDRHKARHARLDYDDLILSARRLLERSGGGSWVLYKLDGGIDHILIDEAQDTNPDQWAIVRALADEFFAGEGARERTRTIFAVGDAKQSIFSFQRADPAEFARMNDYFAGRVADSGATWERVDLDVSFRSAQAVLTAVDAVFADDDARDGLGDGIVRHRAHRSGQAGLVELWPTVKPEEADDLSAWSPPVEHSRERDDPPVRLANVIAGRIARWIDQGERLESRDRPVRPGDIMVLVQRRTGFVDALVSALKKRDIAVAGVDRLVLSDHIAVMDLVALGQFLLLPDDDLTLATVLKGPFVGFDDARLFDLAYDRGDRSLWRELGARASQDRSFGAARDRLTDLLSRVDYVTPFALYADLLGPRRGRERIVARLGVDANDPVDEFLALALAYERSHPPSLQGFLTWFAEGQAEVKRDLEQGDRGQVRIMTVHGAKGLQAPIVFLADTVRTPAQAGASQAQLLWPTMATRDVRTMLWRPRAEFREPVTAGLLDAVKARRDQEYRRLLYVAMTRAEDRLYVCGYQTRHSPSDSCWYRLVERGMADQAEPWEADLTMDAEPPTGWSGPGLRLATPQDAVPDKGETDAGPGIAAAPLPEWARAPAPAEPDPPRPLAPSRPSDDEPPVLSPLGDDGGRRFARGILIHHLLQFLPDMAPEARLAAAEYYLARPVLGLNPDQRAAIIRESLAVLEEPAFAELFGPGARAEVPVVGRVGNAVVSGQIDRMVVSGRDVRIVDYKSNRPAPRRVADVPAIYIRQLAAYRAVLGKIYPDYSISCDLLWTDGPRMMPIPPALLDAHAP